jgi:hypothetical protein
MALAQWTSPMVTARRRGQRTPTCLGTRPGRLVRLSINTIHIHTKLLLSNHPLGNTYSSLDKECQKLDIDRIIEIRKPLDIVKEANIRAFNSRPY